MNFDEWWLFGTKSTAHWGYELIDLTNQYLRQGVEGGVLTMALFITIIVLAFRNVGLGVRRQSARNVKLLIWSMGCALVVHVFSFISVSYFDQNFVVWYMLLAVIATVGALRQTAPVAQRTKPVSDEDSMVLSPALVGQSS